MLFGSVTFMLAERILRKLSAKVTHHPVASDLGDHAGGSDAQADAITVDDGGLPKWKWDHRQAVNQHVVGHAGQRGDGGPHRFVRGAQDIDAVDFNRIDNADRPAQVGL